MTTFDFAKLFDVRTQQGSSLDHQQGVSPKVMRDSEALHQALHHDHGSY